LWGTGVTSLILVIRRPVAWRDRIAASRPDPGPLIITSTVRRPWSIAFRAAASPARCAAKAVPLRDPRNPTVPALAQDSTSPFGSVRVTIVLLNVAETNACPCGTNFLSRRRVRTLLGILCFDSASGRVNHWPVPSTVCDGVLTSGYPARNGRVMTSGLVADLLLVSNCTPATALGPGIGLCALPTCGQAATVAQTTVTSNVD
jgi:hypothetical protein